MVESSNPRLTLLSSIIVLMSLSEALHLDQCARDLGMESGDITDSQLTASSSHNSNSVGPVSGRVRTERRGGAWCPQKVITSQTHEYLQIDLGQITVVTAAETQGRFGNGRGVEWAEMYSLQFWRPTLDGSSGWRTYRNISDATLLDGNVNTYLAHRQKLDPPIIASRIRFVPRSLHPRTVCMRVELYGCPYLDDIEEYQMDVPDPRWPDLTYDGVRSGEVMQRGLGQLADGRMGTDDVTGAEWVGWRGQPGSRINIRFQFSRPRFLESVKLHISNRFTAGIRIFQLANLSFSMDGGQFSTSRSFSFRAERDNIFENSRMLTIPLYGQVARFVSIQLTLADTWLLLSEISFVSDRASTNTSDLNLKTPQQQSRIVSSRPESHPAGAADDTIGSRGGPSGDSAGITVTAMVLGTSLLLLAAAVAGYAVRVSRRRRIAGRTAGPSGLPLALSLGRKGGGIASCGGGGVGRVLVPERAGSWVRSDRPGEVLAEEEKLGLVEDVCRVVRLHDPAIATIKRPMNESAYEYAEPIYTMNVSPIYHVSSIANNPASWENPNYRESSTNTSNDSSGSSVLTVGDFFTLPSPPSVPPPSLTPATLRGGRFTSKPRRRHRLAARGVTGAVGTVAMTTAESDLADDRAVRAALEKFQMDADQFKLLDNIADGRFAEIFTCEVAASPRDECNAVYSQLPCTRVATARVLRCSAAPQLSRQLAREAAALARVGQHPHVAQLVGVGCFDGDERGEGSECSACRDGSDVNRIGCCCCCCRFVLVEHCTDGDLSQFLRAAACGSGRQRQALSLENLLKLAAQIAHGMDHLASLGIAHGDLAARNCLIVEGCQIKISDLGPTRPEYASDYVTSVDGRIVPLRWRSPEGLFSDQFSSSGDVWSFGVILWEMLTWCRLQPMGHLTDAAVTDRLASYFDLATSPMTSDRCESLLPRPPSCPETVFQLMLRCWALEPHMRPPFSDIRQYLQQLMSNPAE